MKKCSRCHREKPDREFFGVKQQPTTNCESCRIKRGNKGAIPRTFSDSKAIEIMRNKYLQGKPL